ncbi:MAG: hypothetical protein F9K46_08230 [Anaerolineae bacterium]|nr:MAG: hypothetical protein F9K46_08230 [Anaerolineae bacterium]
MSIMLFLCSLLMATAACGLLDSEEETNLRDRMGGQISQAQQAQQHAADVWDRVLFGEVVNCGEMITVPEPFFLTKKEADEYPQSVAIRDSLNNALTELTIVANLWEQECSLDREIVPLDVVRQAEDALQMARDLLNQSASLWAVWQA